MNLANPALVLAELVTAVTALKLPASFDATTPSAFDKVKIFDLQDLRIAMEELFAYGNRICLIGLSAVNHQNAVVGRTVKIARTLDLKLLCSDRRYSDRQKALVGDATTPGALLLQTVLVNGLSGELTSGAVMLPGSGRLIALENDKRKDETGRILFAQDFTVATAWDSLSLSRIAKIAPVNS